MRTSPVWKKNLFAILNEHLCYQQLFLPSPSFCGWGRLTKYPENLGFGRQGLHAETFQYPASYRTDHGISITLPSVPLSELERQPVKPARCRTLLQPGANAVAHAGHPGRAARRASPGTHTPGSAALARLSAHLETRPSNSCWAPALKYF